MELFHYMFTQSDEHDAVRILTNCPSEAVRDAYEASKFSKNVETVGHGKLLYSNTGNWTFPLLIERAVNMGIDFRIASYDMATVKRMDEAQVTQLVDKANFAWASVSNMVLVRFEGYDGFDLKPLGLEIENVPKLVKRLTEVLRCTGHHVYDDTGNRFTLREFMTPEGESDIFYDGLNVIRRSFANTLGFEGTRGNIRILTPMGLIKGDCLVVSDNQIDADIVYHTDNLKSELATDGWFLATIMKHEPFHELSHNDQARFNFRSLIPDKVVNDDLKLMVEDWEKSIAEGGDLYDYLNNQQMAFDHPIAVDLERVQMAHRLEDQAELLREVGIPPATFSNIVYTRTGALTRKMDANRIPGTKSFKKMFVPATNAFSGAVTTYEACVNMANMEFLGEDGTRTFFHPEVGLVIPGDRFVDTYDLHGGHDLDDTHSMFAIKVWSSDAEWVETLYDEGVIDPNLVVPDSADAAVSAGLAIRSPNGPGEYSIESISEDMPWWKLNMDTIRTIDLAKAPKPQSMVFEGAPTEKLMTSVSYDDVFDREFVVNMILAQTINPNVGAFANVVMTASDIFGANNIPITLMKLRMEDAIDSVQQMADQLTFTQIADAVREMWIELVDIVLTDKIKVDAGVIATRIPKKLRVGDEDTPIGDAIIEAGLVKGGATYKLHNRYATAIDKLRKASMHTANAARNELPLAQRILRMKFGKDYHTFAVGWLRGCNGQLKKLDREYRRTTAEEEADGDINTMLRREMQNRRRLALENLMDNWVASIISNDRLDTHMQVLALYKAIIMPTEGYPLGEIDRVFVQPSTEGCVSMLQLFIEAVEIYGLMLEDRLS